MEREKGRLLFCIFWQDIQIAQYFVWAWKRQNLSRINELSSNEFQGVIPTLVMDAELQFAAAQLGVVLAENRLSSLFDPATIWGAIFQNFVISSFSTKQKNLIVS